MPNSPQVVSLSVNMRICYLTLPCTHQCTFKYNDGTEKSLEINGRELANNHWNFLSIDAKKHFAEYLELKNNGS